LPKDEEVGDENDVPGVICSQFVEDIFTAIAGIAPVDPWLPLPADIAEDPRFEDVRLSWYRVEGID